MQPYFFLLQRGIFRKLLQPLQAYQQCITVGWPTTHRQEKPTLFLISSERWSVIVDIKLQVLATDLAKWYKPFLIILALPHMQDPGIKVDIIYMQVYALIPAKATTVVYHQ